MSNKNNISEDNPKQNIVSQSNNSDISSNKISNNDNSNLTKISLDDINIDKIILLKSEENYFKKGEKIVKYFLKGQEKKPMYIVSPIYGKLLKYDQDEKLFILEECTHEKFYFNLCIKCGFKKTEEFDIKNNNTYKKCGFISNEFTFSKKEAEYREKIKVDQYLSEKKLVLILDLDNTILHACPYYLDKQEIENLIKKYGSSIAKLFVKKELNSLYDKILIKFRPFIKSFFKNIKNKYEIVIYTHGTKEYAKSIIQYINTTFEEDSLSIDRMMYRELDDDGFAKCKSIKNVFPTMENMILILDDHIEVWKESGENFICIYPYKFFNEKEINNMHFQIPKEKYLKYEYDNVLYCIVNLLLYVHKKFYEFYTKFKCMKSVQRITKEKLWSIFSGKKIYYYQNYFNLEKINKKKKAKKEKEKEKNDKKNNEIKENENEKKNEIKEIEKENEKIEEKKNEIKEKENEKSEEIKNEIKENKDDEKEERNYEEEKKWIDLMKEKVEKLGGVFIENVNDKFSADLFLTNFYDDTDKVIQEIEDYNNKKDTVKKIPILHSHYVEICFMYYTEVNIEDFYLTKEIKCLKYLELNKIFEKNKPKIDEFYGNLAQNFEN